MFPLKPPPAVIFDRLTFVLQYIVTHPEIFGPVDMCDKFHQGCSLLHTCWDTSVCKLLMDTYKLDWRALDDKGHNAIECQARNANSCCLPTLLQQLTDSEFAQYCTPDIWGAMVGSGSALDDAYRHCLGRLVELFPDREDKWKEIVRVAVHVHLRTEAYKLLTGILKDYNGLHFQRLRRLVYDVLLEPFEHKVWMKRFTYYNHNNYALPVPHLLCLASGYDLLQLVTSEFKNRMTKSEFEVWAGQTTTDGLDWKEFTLKSAEIYQPREKVQSCTRYFTWTAM